MGTVFKTGQRVRASDHREGEIAFIKDKDKYNGNYPIVVLFDNDDIRTYTKEGRSLKTGEIVLKVIVDTFKIPIGDNTFNINKRYKGMILHLLSSLEQIG